MKYKKKNLKKVLSIVLILSLLIINLDVLARPLPEADHEFYVYDEALVLDSKTKDYIINTNKSLYQKTDAQIVVAIIEDLDGEDINYFATKLFEKWEIGGKKEDNGLLILLDMESRNIWIEVGYGLEGPLPDSRVKGIIDDYMIPEFKEGNYNGGILSGFDRILEYIEIEYGVTIDHRDAEYVEANRVSNESDNFTRVLELIFIILVFYFFFFGGGGRPGRRRYWYTTGRPRGGYYGGGHSGGSGGSSGGGGRSGGGGAGGSW